MTRRGAVLKLLLAPCLAAVALAAPAAWAEGAAAPPAVGALPPALVGAWHSGDLTLAKDLTPTGTQPKTSGRLAEFRFSPDGRYVYARVWVKASKSCSRASYYSAVGRAQLVGDTLALVPSRRSASLRDSCDSSRNYTKAAPVQEETFYWAVDQYQLGSKLCLEEAKPSHAASPDCTYLRDATSPAVATTVETGYGTARWQLVRPVTNSGNDVTALSCPSAGLCVAVDNAGHALRSTNGGATWAGVKLEEADVLVSVSCPSPSFCLALQGDVDAATWASTDEGRTWARHPISTADGDGFVYVGCPRAQLCLAVGSHGGVWASTDEGRTWSARHPPTSSGPNLEDVTCPAANLCIAVGATQDYYPKAAFLVSTNGGSTWTAGAPVKVPYLSSVSCLGAKKCVAVGGNYHVLDNNLWTCWDQSTFCRATGDEISSGALLTTGDGGRSWAPLAPSFDGPLLVYDWGPDLRGVSCVAGTNFCAAVGSAGTILTTANGGATWTSQVASGGDWGPALVAVACPTTQECVAVGWGGETVRMH